VLAGELARRHPRRRVDRRRRGGGRQAERRNKHSDHGAALYAAHIAAVTQTHFRTCPLCEATCGLAIDTSNGDVVKIRGDADDVFSRGFLCPKAHGLKALHEDPDRLRTPLVRAPDGSMREATWDEAFEEIDRRLTPILSEHGRDAVAAYIGNPNAHNLSALIYGRAWLRALGSKNIYSASTVDQMPKQLASGLMFGTMLGVPIPDIDRTDHMLMLGANPLASNGSLFTVPDARGRLRHLRERGGKVVVVDPRRSRTAEVSDEHHFIRPGTDAHLLLAMVHVLFEDGLTAVGRLGPWVNGLEEVQEVASGFTPEMASEACGIPAAEIRRIAHELAAAPRAVVYARIGTCTQEFGTIASWLVDVLNVLTGNLDSEGGAMFTLAAAGQANARGEGGRGRGVRTGRWSTRVRGLPEVYGELPVVCLAEEIDTPGEGQVRALVTAGGNPVLSTPNSGRLESALESLDFMLSIDIYLNETTRHADVVLPAPSPLAKSHYDLVFTQFATRNVANYSPAVFPDAEDVPPEWTTLLRLTGVLTGQGPNADVEAIDDFVAAAVAKQYAPDRDPADVLESVEPRRGPERVLDLMLRHGPYRLTLQDLEDNPHGIDLGPMQPRVPEVLRTPSGKIELAPSEIVADVARLEASLGRHRNGGMVLIGRRQLRSNNSWMHNLEPLVKGKDRCTMHVHPSDAERLGLSDGALARVSSRVGMVEAPVEVTDAIMPGVVSIPHGWGHGAPGARMAVAAEHAGVNSNLLADETLFEPLSGNAVLNGIPVEVAPVAAPAEPAVAAPTA
jgi:anaerobic selenocysteine-containing dehydrogenase